MWCCGRLGLGLMLWRLLLQLHVISIRHAVMLANELLLLSTECSKQVGHPLFLISWYSRKFVVGVIDVNESSLHSP